ncbi:MAG: 6-carboxytetrahydropterin synthase, partial [Planctomycetales bacterium]|nr:6-carboxytetrahydropterin synthase [Planctomycetales bacterium]
QVRFSIAPFLPVQPMGFKSYASKPAAEGLCLYLALWVDLAGPLNPVTGFVVNVSQIDQVVRRDAIPLLTRVVQDAFGQRQTLNLSFLASCLGRAWKAIAVSFDSQILSQLRLELNPFKYLAIETEDAEMFIYSEKFEFSAMHKLWNEAFDPAKNIELFGKCANPAGHGHNYILQVQVQKKADSQEGGWHCDFERVVTEHFLDLVDHKNLNVDVPGLESMNPTVENLAFFAWEKLEGQFENAKLCKITVWENDRTYCSYCR